MGMSGSAIFSANSVLAALRISSGTFYLRTAVGSFLLSPAASRATDQFPMLCMRNSLVRRHFLAIALLLPSDHSTPTVFQRDSEPPGRSLPSQRSLPYAQFHPVRSLVRDRDRRRTGLASTQC